MEMSVVTASDMCYGSQPRLADMTVVMAFEIRFEFELQDPSIFVCMRDKHARRFRSSL
jgi:hypothetical protein